jgi:hypothetical protein
MTKEKEYSPEGQRFLEAAKLHCRSQIKEAEAKIELYLNYAQGVADHSAIMKEILDAAKQGAHAHDVLRFLQKRT